MNQPRISSNEMPRSIHEAHASMAAGRLDARQLLELTRAAADRNEGLNPLAYVDWDRAQRQAAAADERRARGLTMGPLDGVPVSIKDLFCVDGMPTRGGTRAQLPPICQGEALLVSRLRAAGAVIFGKTNMHEIALGATGENAWTGDVKNPFNPAHQAGGSSSGAAVCVATGIGMAGVGSDTGGSVRIPAAFCGLAGFKPTYGAIPLDNALYLSWTCDHAGPLARNVADCGLLYEVMSGRSAAHGAVGRAPRLAVPANWLDGRLAPQVRDNFEQVLALCRRIGATIDEVALPELPNAWICYSPIVRAEAAWVHRQALAAGGEGFSPAVLEPMQLGGKLLATAYIDALQMRSRVSADLDRCLRDVDALILPTTAVPAPRRGQTDVVVEGGTLSVREAVLGQTLPFSLCGLPSLSLPSGLADGLPLSMSLVGARDQDAHVLALGGWLEHALAA